ncbi:hypothetical protein AMATHDRAFT_69265 [Amanita thiersii Skay4041]|uniref:Uncharacterized protein n=1 Tax=Amanita thiersii Skay4041 TaxID=703135 RepID=A0A2A9NG22_9AGAR|nr:hypothetical protein AMATHDRAFT_69265 [Amanita thiersii Skay4041]
MSTANSSPRLSIVMENEDRSSGSYHHPRTRPPPSYEEHEDSSATRRKSAHEDDNEEEEHDDDDDEASIERAFSIVSFVRQGSEETMSMVASTRTTNATPTMGGGAKKTSPVGSKRASIMVEKRESLHEKNDEKNGTIWAWLRGGREELLPTRVPEDKAEGVVVYQKTAVVMVVDETPPDGGLRAWLVVFGVSQRPPFSICKPFHETQTPYISTLDN